MAKNPSTKTANNGFCIKQAYVEITHDTPSSASDDTVDWFEVPLTKSVTLAFEDSNESEIRTSGDGGQFLTPCGTSSRTRTYTVTYVPVRDEPVEWFFDDGSTYWFRVYFGKTDAAAGDDQKWYHYFQAKIEKTSFNLDNSSRDVREETYTLSPSSTVEEIFPNQTEMSIAGTPFPLYKGV